MLVGIGGGFWWSFGGVSVEFQWSFGGVLVEFRWSVSGVLVLPVGTSISTEKRGLSAPKSPKKIVSSSVCTVPIYLLHYFDFLCCKIVV